VQRLLKASALPLEKSLPNFDVKRLPVTAQRQLRALLEGRFLDRNETDVAEGTHEYHQGLAATAAEHAMAADAASADGKVLYGKARSGSQQTYS
jgi:hypothetical protein